MSNLINSINQVISENNLPFKWSKKINNELENIKSFSKLKRKDLTKKPFITIDGEDAKDFDDAVFCIKKSSNFILYVAIADVAEVVASDSELDKEALKRGTSIYFPNKVIPMLPEEISNDICSLVPNKNRNVLVCEISFDLEGNINSYEFFEAVINSHKRLTYNEVEDEDNLNINPNIKNSITAIKDLTKKLIKNRINRCALEINTSEPGIKINKNGDIDEIFLPKRLFAHLMIEECMIAANICAAKFIKKHLGFGVYRTHEEPEKLKIENLKKFFLLQGLTSKSFLKPLELINSFIKHINKDEDNKIMNILILQSLKRAQYSTKEVGHFGLQLKEYSHFTSPIRRYPDLITHRLIKKILKKDKKSLSKEKLEETLADLSALEKRAEHVSRQVTQQLICHYLKKFIGDEFSSMIVGIAEFGLFCEIEKYYISGLLHVSDLSHDRYYFDKEANMLRGRRTGRTFRIGQKVNVQLANVIPDERKIILIEKLR
ncbi:MAG: hypothetical protein CMD46_06300 [Gammaproteobacteria bacterium]|nr:hypothetical protein [Gammaproteobacteria bacterium]|tara:strand:+ start:2091 stop:3560 length:1470 start_codon:yes stop_codon:yes gene_type:complete